MSEIKEFEPETLCYEEKLKELQSCIDLLQDEQCSLDETLRNYEKANRLYESCLKELDAMEEKLSIINEGQEERFERGEVEL